MRFYFGKTHNLHKRLPQRLACGVLHTLANSPDSTLRRKSAKPLSVMYCLPQMFTVTNQPLRRQRHAVVSEIPDSRQNLTRLIKGLLSDANIGGVFMR